MLQQRRGNISLRGEEMKVWKLWAKSLGEKVGTDKDADSVAIMRTLIVFVNFSTCFIIIAGVLHHW
jgi:hypothetical protein